MFLLLYPQHLRMSNVVFFNQRVNKAVCKLQPPRQHRVICKPSSSESGSFGPAAPRRAPVHQHVPQAPCDFVRSPDKQSNNKQGETTQEELAGKEGW